MSFVAENGFYALEQFFFGDFLFDIISGIQRA